MNKQISVVALAAAHTAAIVAIGYVLLGLVPMALFAFGFVGGLAIWLVARDEATFADLRLPTFSPSASSSCTRSRSASWTSFLRYRN